MPDNKYEIEEFANELYQEMYAKIKDKYPERFPGLDQLKVHDLLKDAIKKALDKYKAEQEQVLDEIVEILAIRIRAWWN